MRREGRNCRHRKRVVVVVLVVVVEQRVVRMRVGGVLHDASR
jgi:hypothetical protein